MHWSVIVLHMHKVVIEVTQAFLGEVVKNY